jgi:hypothetical protein
VVRVWFCFFDLGDVGGSTALPSPIIPRPKGLSSPHPNDPLRGISSFLRVSAPPWCAFGFAFSIWLVAGFKFSKNVHFTLKGLFTMP